jgi:hypothetical protein
MSMVWVVEIVSKIIALVKGGKILLTDDLIQELMVLLGNLLSRGKQWSRSRFIRLKFGLQVAVKRASAP